MARIVKSVCQMCGITYGACGIDVHVRDGKIVRIEGTKGHPVNNGRLCAKGLAAIQMEYDPNRLLYPMKRVGERGEGKWQRISWDEAMDTIVTRLKGIIETDGARAIGWLKGQGPGWEGNLDYCRRFVNAIGTPNLFATGNICETPRILGDIYTYGTKTSPDYENTRCMVLWGYNPINASLPNIAVRVMKAKQRGAKLVVIDPRFSRTAAKADIFIRPRPGTDGALALAMLNVIIEENLYDKEFVDKWTDGFDKLSELAKQYPPQKVAEITWVPADTIREVARIYATTKPAIIHEQNGLDQQPNVVQTCRALSILRTITGNLDMPGGEVWNPEAPPFFSRMAPIAMRGTEETVRKAFEESVSKHPLFYQSFAYISPKALLDAIITGEPYPIRAIIAQGMNPVITTPNTTRVRQALKKVDFLVVFNTVMNATTELADIALPAATFLERTLLHRLFKGAAKPRVDMAYYQLSLQAVKPSGEAKSDYDFISELTRRMGYEEAFPWKSVEEAIDYELKPTGITYKELEDYPEDIIKYRYTPKELYRKYEKFLALPMLPAHKVALYCHPFEAAGYDPLPTYIEPAESPVSSPDLLKEYPLVGMASLKPILYTHSQFHGLPWLKEIMPDPWIEMHPQKAKELGIEDGDMVTVESLRGSLEIKCQLINTLDPRVVAITHGWGDPYAASQPITNILTPPEIRCPISDAPANRSFLLNVTKKA